MPRRQRAPAPSAPPPWADPQSYRRLIDTAPRRTASFQMAFWSEHNGPSSWDILTFQRAFWSEHKQWCWDFRPSNLRIETLRTAGMDRRPRAEMRTPRRDGHGRARAIIIVIILELLIISTLIPIIILRIVQILTYYNYNTRRTCWVSRRASRRRRFRCRSRRGGAQRACRVDWGEACGGWPGSVTAGDRAGPQGTAGDCTRVTVSLTSAFANESRVPTSSSLESVSTWPIWSGHERMDVCLQKLMSKTTACESSFLLPHLCPRSIQAHRHRRAA